ncbi:MAG: response regulator [Planctomycetes bacterium]|nr:response regulator [Planctomycetota bacterium]
MNGRLRIAVADDEPDMREYFNRVLPRLGHEVVCVADNGRDLIAQCRVCMPDLVITDIKMPAFDGIEAAKAISAERPTPIILVSAHYDSELIQRAEADHVMAYLVKPIKQADLEPAIAIATRRFQQFQQVQREAADLRQALKDRKVIERAKGLVMRRAGIDEAAAFRRLQQLASDRNRKLVDIAEAIVVAAEAFDSTIDSGND